jgi:hypothetical protein
MKVYEWDHKRNDCISVGWFFEWGPNSQVDSPIENQQISNLVIISLKTDFLVFTHVRTQY